MISLHCFWAKLDNRMGGQYKCNVTLLLFCFCCDFAHSHAPCDCCSIVCLHFQDVQIKQVDWTPKVKGWKNFGRSWTRGVGGLENWAIFQERHMCIVPVS